ncbi:MAG: nucleotidyltransferase family protein [Chloroflexota bacterium]
MTLFTTLCHSLARGKYEPLLAADSDWRRLNALAQQHRLAGYFYLQLEQSPNRRRIPADVWQDWMNYYLRQWTKNERLLSVLQKLNDTFGDEVLFLKGLPLAQQLYGRYDARAISDLDLLVKSPEAVTAVLEKLDALGYKQLSGTFITPTISRRFSYHVECCRDNIAIEPHWGLLRHPAVEIPIAKLWKEADRVTINGRCYPTLSLEHSLLAYILSIPVDLQVDKLVLRPFFEMFLLVQQLGNGFDWAMFMVQRRTEGSWVMSQVVLTAVLTLFDCQQQFPQLATQLEPEFTAQAKRLVVWLAADEQPTQNRWQREWHAKREAFALYECSLPIAWGWWAFSLPARTIIHKTESRRRRRWK